MVSPPRPSLSELIGARLGTAATVSEDVRALGSATAIKRFKEGMIGLPRLRADLVNLGYSGEQLERLVIQAQYEYEYDLFVDQLDALRTAVRNNRLTPNDFASALQQMGMVAERASVLADNERIRLLGKATPPPTPTS